jgi:hypothetical protein
VTVLWDCVGVIGLYAAADAASARANPVTNTKSALRRVLRCVIELSSFPWIPFVEA